MSHKDRHNSESTQDNKELRKEIERLRKVIDNMRSRSDVYELKITTEDGEVVKTFRATYWKRKDAMNDLGVYGRKFDTFSHVAPQSCEMFWGFQPSQSLFLPPILSKVP